MCVKLCYVIYFSLCFRMGSFNSTPKINNIDSQDDGIEITDNLPIPDFLYHCKMMRGENRPQLLTRYFLRPSFDHPSLQHDITDGLRILNLEAVSKTCSAPSRSPKHIRLLQWNILSQCKSSGQVIILEVNFYLLINPLSALGQHNDGFVSCPDEALTWECRKFQIVQEIIQTDPDVICLQEVDHFKFLQNMLRSQNYDGVFFPKPDSPCLYVNDNNGPDGCAIFYKKNKFELLTCVTRVLEVWRVQSNQVAMAANLRVIETGDEFCLGTTHLKARNGALLSKLRNEQGKDLMRFIKDVAESRPILLSGDFNAEPVEPVYSTILNFKGLQLSSAYADLLGDKMGLKGNEENFAGEKKELQHDCEDDKGAERTPAEESACKEPPYTTWKIREDGEVCHTLDYVFYSKNRLKVNNCLMIPQGHEIGKNRVPSFQYPSDHFSLVCDFELCDEE